MKNDVFGVSNQWCLMFWQLWGILLTIGVILNYIKHESMFSFAQSQHIRLNAAIQRSFFSIFFIKKSEKPALTQHVQLQAYSVKWLKLKGLASQKVVEYAGIK